MGVCYKDNRDDVNGSVGLLISILVRYPEVATINFDPEKQLLKFTFIYSGVLEDKELDNLKAKLIDSIEIYNMLEHKEISVVSLQSQVYDKLTIIEVQRDVDTLVQEEITLIVELFHRYLNNNLVTEENERYFEEDLVAHEEIIGHNLAKMKGASHNKYLFAFREEGKVLVFDK
ncbi:MAG: hypothetical protein A4E53_02724 [Pelotomaculum sp. PtaB.Bin104]|nr:MAG: hypothetical protein A4E53_02724 [Pelotomaculum sp. PtaB.Bin104]